MFFCSVCTYLGKNGSIDGRVEVDIYNYTIDMMTFKPMSLKLVNIDGVFVDLRSTDYKTLEKFREQPVDKQLEIIKNEIISIGKVFDEINKCFFVVYSTDSAGMEYAHIYEYTKSIANLGGKRHTKYHNRRHRKQKSTRRHIKRR